MSAKIDIVITMAGLGSRFRKAGYDMPKYMIEAHGKTLFEWSLISLKGYQDHAGQYIFIVRKGDHAGDFIAGECSRLGIRNHRLVEIDYLTDGQATTAMLACEVWDKDNQLLIYNIDTYVEAGQMCYDQLKGDGFIPCFRGEGDHWSFVRLDDTQRAVEVREKVRISDYCTVGAYYFSSAGLYETLYREYYSDQNNLEKGEKYVAPLYNYMISKHMAVYISDIAPEAVHVLGTPEELELFVANYRPL